MLKKIIAGFTFFACVFFACLLHAAQKPTIFYVSPDGKDEWSGLLAVKSAGGADGPLASFEGARDAIRKLRSDDGLLPSPVKVIFAAGDYRISSILFFTPADTGTAQCPIVYEAAAGAKVVFRGGSLIRNWDKSGKLWRAKLRGIKGIRSDFAQLFVNGKRYTRARWPNADKLWNRFEAISVSETEASGIFAKGAMKEWRKQDPVELYTMRSFDISRFRVASVDKKERAIKLSFPKTKKILGHWRGDRRYFLENSKSFLDAPGEWFYDRREDVLYVYPLKDDMTGDFRVVAPNLTRLVRIAGTAQNPVRHVVFRNLEFAMSATRRLGTGYYDGHQGDVEAGAAIVATNYENGGFKNCRFTNLGLSAVMLRSACRNIEISRCEFSRVGGNAVIIGEKKYGGAANELISNSITDCTIQYCGELFYGACAIWVGHALNTKIARNHIHHMPYTGISVGWFRVKRTGKPTGNIVEENRVHHVMLKMGDGAAIYTFNGQHGTIIRNNIIHDIFGRMAGGNGIYLDEGTRGVLVENNLVARVQGVSMVFHKGIENICRNNIFALPTLHVFHDGGARGNVVERNIIYFKDGAVMPLRWTTRATLNDYNLYHSVTGKGLEFEGGMSLKEWLADGQDSHSIFADPHFVDVEKGDFNLKPDSPALKLGFKPFNSPVLGPAPADPLRKERLAEMHGWHFKSIKGNVPAYWKNRVRPRCRVKRIEKPIVIDGSLSDDGWKKARLYALVEHKGGRENPPRHFARMLHDGENLYVSLINYLPDMNKIRNKGNRWARDDGAEVCFQGVTDKGRGPTYVLRGYANGYFTSSVEAGASRKDAKALQRKVEYKVALRPKYWNAEWKIPLAAANIKLGKELKEMRFNIGVRKAIDREWRILAYTGDATWIVLHGARLKFE